MRISWTCHGGFSSIQSLKGVSEPPQRVAGTLCFPKDDVEDEERCWQAPCRCVALHEASEIPSWSCPASLRSQGC